MTGGREVCMPATATTKPVAEKLNPAWEAAVRRVLGAAPRGPHGMEKNAFRRTV
jgi:hypothetical protein